MSASQHYPPRLRHPIYTEDWTLYLYTSFPGGDSLHWPSAPLHALHVGYVFGLHVITKYQEKKTKKCVVIQLKKKYKHGQEKNVPTRN